MLRHCDMLDGLLVFRRDSQKNMDKSYVDLCLGLLLVVLLGRLVVLYSTVLLLCTFTKL